MVHTTSIHLRCLMGVPMGHLRWIDGAKRIKTSHDWLGPCSTAQHGSYCRLSRRCSSQKQISEDSSGLQWCKQLCTAVSPPCVQPVQHLHIEEQIQAILEATRGGPESQTHLANANSRLRGRILQKGAIYYCRRKFQGDSLKAKRRGLTSSRWSEIISCLAHARLSSSYMGEVSGTKLMPARPGRAFSAGSHLADVNLFKQHYHCSAQQSSYLCSE